MILINLAEKDSSQKEKNKNNLQIYKHNKQSQKNAMKKKVDKIIKLFAITINNTRFTKPKEKNQSRHTIKIKNKLVKT